MKSFKSVALATAAAVGVSIITIGSVGAAPTRQATALVVTSAQDLTSKGGHVFYDDGRKLYVNARCKADLVDAGVTARVIPASDVQARDHVPKDERDTCPEVIADLAAAPTSTAPGSDAGSSIVLHVTPGTSNPNKGGFVVTAGETWTHVTRNCKASLLDEGIETRSATWSDVDEFSRDQSLTCQEFEQMLDGSTPAPTGAKWVTIDDEADTTYDDGRTTEKYFFFDPDDHDDPTWDTSRIGWLVECDSVKFEQVDPIVAPGRVSHHLHEFFGNANVTSTSTTQDFADTPRDDIQCTDVNDKSAYWSPAVYQDGRRVTAELFKAYYKSTTPDVEPMPLGLRMVAGNAAASGNQNRVVGWFEEQRTDDLTPKEDLSNTVGADEMITRQNPDVNIVLRVNFPNCWDGVHLDSVDHQSHMAYFNEKSLTCPDTHPVKIPQLTTFTQYDVDGGAGFSLASGQWYSFHQDFWNAWSPDQMADLTDECIVAELNCRVRGSNALKSRGQYSQFVPTAD